MSQTLDILNLRYLGAIQGEVHFEKPICQSLVSKWKLKAWNLPQTLTVFSNLPTRLPLFCTNHIVIERVATVAQCDFSLPGHC